MDNGSSHTSKATRAWIAAHPRFSVTFTPKHASWLNIIEQWFSILARKLLRRGSFESQDGLDSQITEFTIGCNKTAHPGNGSTTPTLSTPGTSSATPRKRASPGPPDSTGRGEEPLRDQ